MGFVLNYSHVFLDMQKPKENNPTLMPVLYLKKPYILKARTCIEILHWNGSHMKDAQIGNFNLPGS